MKRASAGLALVSLCAIAFSHCTCGPKQQKAPSGRCDLDLSGFSSELGNTAVAKVIEGPEELIGGEAAQGRIGDYLLKNDKVRVVIQAPDRHIGPLPYGGDIIDADLVHSGPGNDQLGELGLLYNLGRTVDADKVEVLKDGVGGGPAVIAATGRDAVNDYINLKSFLSILGAMVVDPDAPVPLTLTTYYVLNPGESRVHVVSALCNEGEQALSMPVGDLIDSGGSVALFNPQSPLHGLGYQEISLDELMWLGILGDGVAYGYAPYKPNDSRSYELQNAVTTVAGVTGTIIGGHGAAGLTSWFDAKAARRPGALIVPARGSAFVARDFVVGRDLGEVNSLLAVAQNAVSGEPIGELDGLVTRGGAPVPNARVALERSRALPDVGPSWVVETVFTTDSQGRFRGHLTATEYQVSGWAEGSLVAGPTTLQVATGAPTSIEIKLDSPRSLHVSVAGTDGAPLPAKLTLLCNGVCPVPRSSLRMFSDQSKDALPDNVALFGLVPPSGSLDLSVPPGSYSLVVTRGPEYSAFPPTWPASGYPVDLSVSTSASVQALLSHVVDTTGYMSADFHVHAVNSPDSEVANLDRVLTFLAEGVDVIVSTDHDYLTDYGPLIAALGGQALMGNVVGEEVSPFDYGHYNLFPLSRDPADLIGGAIDWAGGADPGLSPAQIFAQGRARGAGTVHFNHPRGGLGGLSRLQADIPSLATHADPAPFRIQPNPSASAADTGLLSADFNAFEVLNAATDGLDPNAAAAHALFNDWFSLLSRGLPVAGTGVSDTHRRWTTTAGYWRTFVRVGVDRPADLTPEMLSTHLNQMEASVSNAPFVRLRARKAGDTVEVAEGALLVSGGAPVELTVDVQIPTWLDVSSVEIHSHAAGRESSGGQANESWDPSRIVAQAPLSLMPADRVPVETVGGVSYERYGISRTFTVTPAADTWYVAMVHGSGSLFPLRYGSLVNGAAKPVHPFAFTNPVRVDVNGDGYQPPLFGKWSAPLPQHPRAPPAPRSLQELLQRLREELKH